MRPAKILVLHNHYQRAGGEDGVFEHEVKLLRSKGHTVIEYIEDNEGVGEGGSLREGLTAIWSRRTMDRLGHLLDAERPDIAHFHNTFARISPAAYYACRRRGVPVVQTLHNFRIGCLNATCMTGGNSCERCLPHLIPISGIMRGCYRDSPLLSAGMAAITVTHKLAGTYRNQVDAYIALTEFARSVHIRSGLPADKVFVKPNFSDVQQAPPVPRGGYALFAGRLCREKGLSILLEAWKKNGLTIPLKIVGDGPYREEVVAAAAQMPNVEWLGFRSREDVLDLMRRAEFLVSPSLTYENFPLCLAEAFSVGLPCLVSARGAMQEIVQDGETGLHFHPGDPADLANKVRWLADHPAERLRIGAAARARHAAVFAPNKNYTMLLRIYETAASNMNRNRRSAASRDSQQYAPIMANGSSDS